MQVKDSITTVPPFSALYYFSLESRLLVLASHGVQSVREMWLF